MNTHHTVVDLPSIAVVLATGTDLLLAALSGAGLVQTTNRFAVSMVLGDDLLAAVSELLFIPLDRFEEALQSPRRGLEVQGDGLGRLAMQVG